MSDFAPPEPKKDASELWVNKPAAPIVDGVPTGQTAHPDDDSHAFSTETTVKGPAKYGNDKVKYQSAADANHSVDRATTTTVTEGNVTGTTTATTGGKANWSAKTAGVSHGTSHEHKVGEGTDAMTLTKGKQGAVDVGLDGGTASFGTNTALKAGDSSHGNAKGATAGYRDGHVVLDVSSTAKRGHGDHGHETARKLGISGGELTGGLSNKREQVVSREMVDGQEVVKKKSVANSAKLGINTDGVSAGAGRTYTGANGTSNAVNAGAKIDRNGNASVNAGFTRTTKDGNSVSVSAKAGTTVECGDITEENGRYIVSYKRTNSVGGSAGGSHKGVGASAGVTHDSFDVGTRSFATKAEAEEFKKHAAQHIQKDAPNPRTLAGAMAMEVGESLGHGDSTTGTLGASASFEGATLGVSGSEKSTDEKTVRRVSANIFEVTSSHGNTSGKDLNFSGNGIGLNKGGSDSTGKAVTYRFDLSTPEGQLAFQNYQTFGVLPTTGGTLVSETDSKGEESHDGVTVFGLLSDVYSKDSWESTTVGENGKQEEYGGRQSHTVSTGRVGHWLGDKNITESVALTSRQQDDKVDSYRLEAHYGGESGSTNRKNMKNLVSDYDDTKGVDAKSSGDWKLTAEIDPEAMKRWMTHIGETKGLTNPDDQMKALSELMKEHGADMAGGIEYGGDTQLAWNVELKGDKNFPGAKGRAEHDAKVKAYAALMDISMGSPGVIVGQLQTEISELQARKKAVGDHARYSDLPDKLRMQQQELIEYQIAELQAIRHAGLTEMSKNTVGEDIGAITARAGDEHGYDKMPADQREMAKMRDEIAMLDAQLTKFEADNMQARKALSWAFDHYTDAGKAREVGSKNQTRAKDHLELGRATDDLHRRRSIGEVDDLRSEFLLNMNEPQKALAYGRSLKDRLRKEVAEETDASSALKESAHIQTRMNSNKALAGKNAAFWADIDDDDYELPTYEDPYAQEPTSLTLP